MIGTPCSTHSASLRERGNSARYWKIMRHLIGAGHSLYLTDVSKFWARDHRVPASAERVYRALLQSELTCILKGYLRANDVDPAMGVVGLAEVITKAIAQLERR